jgi:uncharacterized protein (DUF1810 family)
MDTFDLGRFVQAQTPLWPDITRELREGRKRTHWMWFVFPQLAALGRSGTARFYGIQGLEEAKAYLAHPVLGARLRECCELLLRWEDRSAESIFGGIDAMKLRSSLTLFALAAPDELLFTRCLERYFNALPDPLTQELVARA